MTIQINWIKGRDYLLYVHCVCASLSGFVVVITSYASSNYFSKSRAFVSSLLAGAGISSTMWFSIFQVNIWFCSPMRCIEDFLWQTLIDNHGFELSSLSYIWLSFSVLMFLTSFLFLDWNYSFLNLPYKFDVQLEITDQSIEIKIENKKFQLFSLMKISDESNENPFWKYFLSPLYILVVLFLSIVIIPSVFLSVIWEPFITFVTKQNQSLGIEHYRQTVTNFIQRNQKNWGKQILSVKYETKKFLLKFHWKVEKKFQTKMLKITKNSQMFLM